MKYCSLFGNQCFKFNLVHRSIDIPRLRNMQKQFTPPDDKTVLTLRRFMVIVPAALVMLEGAEPNRWQQFDNDYRTKRLRNTLAVFEY